MSTASLTATAPTPVRYAYRLWLFVIGTQVLAAVASEIADPSSDFSNAREIALYLGLAAFVLAILAVFWLFARRMRDGRNWARVVLLIGTLLTLPGLRDVLAPVTGVGDVVGIVLSVGISVLAVIAVGLSFSRPAAPWFRNRPTS